MRFWESGVGEFSARLGDRASKFTCGFDPFLDDLLGVGDRFGVRLTVGHAAGEFRHFDNETIVVFAPVNDQLIARLHEARSERTEMSSSTSSQ